MFLVIFLFCCGLLLCCGHPQALATCSTCSLISLNTLYCQGCLVKSINVREIFVDLLIIYRSSTFRPKISLSIAGYLVSCNNYIVPLLPNDMAILILTIWWLNMSC